MEKMDADIKILDDQESLINQILPEEILEKIFSFTSQYNDYINISQVCIKWYRIIHGLRNLNKTTFVESLKNGHIYWRCFEQKDSPMQRHSHSSVRVGDKLFIFGGFSGISTSYNDLWILDLNTKQWYRPPTSGSYPSPKAAATLLAFNNNKSLILYGGYSHPHSYPFNQQVNFFDELHIYETNNANVDENDSKIMKTYTCFSKIFAQDVAPKLAGHTASILNKNKMILFGGCNGFFGNKSNHVYCLDLDYFKWCVSYNLSQNQNQLTPNNQISFRNIDGFRPEPRYGHSQISLDNERILIVGGCDAPNKQYDDIWILNWPMDESINASWQRVLISGFINAPSQLYCISFVRDENKLITFGKPRMPQTNSLSNAFSGLIGEGFQISTKYTNEINPFTIFGKPKQAQPRICSCSSSKESKNSISSKSILSPNGNINTNLASLIETNQLNNKNESSSSLKLFKCEENSLIEKHNSLNDLQKQEDKSIILNKSQRNTIKRLEALKKVATQFKNLKDEKERKIDKIAQQLNNTACLTKSQNQCVVHSKSMQTFILDISELQNQSQEMPSVKWETPIAHFYQAPPDTILYSLTKGIDEIILFGGMELDNALIQIKSNNESLKQKISNKLYIMKPADLFISSSPNNSKRKS